MKRFLPFLLFATCGLFLTACHPPTEDEKVKQEYEQLIPWLANVATLNRLAEDPYIRDGECNAPELKDAKKGVKYCKLLSKYFEIDVLTEYETLIKEELAELEKIPTTTPLMITYREKMKKALMHKIALNKQILFSGGASYDAEEEEKIDKEYTDAFIPIYKLVCEKFNLDGCGVNFAAFNLAGSKGQMRIMELIQKYIPQDKIQPH